MRVESVHAPAPSGQHLIHCGDDIDLLLVFVHLEVEIAGVRRGGRYQYLDDTGVATLPKCRVGRPRPRAGHLRGGGADADDPALFDPGEPDLATPCLRHADWHEGQGGCRIQPGDLQALTQLRRSEQVAAFDALDQRFGLGARARDGEAVTVGVLEDRELFDGCVGAPAGRQRKRRRALDSDSRAHDVRVYDLRVHDVRVHGVRAEGVLV